MDGELGAVAEGPMPAKRLVTVNDSVVVTGEVRVGQQGRRDGEEKGAGERLGCIDRAGRMIVTRGFDEVCDLLGIQTIRDGSVLSSGVVSERQVSCTLPSGGLASHRRVTSSLASVLGP